jgi:hypothetical protein
MEHKFDNDPKARTMAELVTPRQLVAVRAICNKQRLDAGAECAACFGEPVKPEELSRKAASFFIDFLKRPVAAENVA